MGETRVDLQHLLEDLRDAYTGPIEETILTEVVANALDSGATRIRLSTNTSDATLTLVDNGRGMQRRELARYHDVAASTKRRGEGIGFAGVGIKLGLLVSREVITESRRGATHVATRWHLASPHRAPWKWMPPPGLTTARGTAVRLILTYQLSPLGRRRTPSVVGFIERTSLVPADAARRRRRRHDHWCCWRRCLSASSSCDRRRCTTYILAAVTDVIDESLPGADLVRTGIEDLRRGHESVEALLVLVGAPRLRRLGIDVPSSGMAQPEHRLYELLARSDSDSAHGRYNGLIRRLVSFERAAECVRR